MCAAHFRDIQQALLTHTDFEWTLGEFRVSLKISISITHGLLVTCVLLIVVNNVEVPLAHMFYVEQFILLRR